MPTLRFTDKVLRGLSTEKVQEDFYDEDFSAFGVRVSSAGRRTFFLRFRAQGKHRRVVLGQYPQMSLAEARTRARVVLGEVAQGNDPGAEREAVRTSLTFAKLAEEYIERHAKRVKRSWRHDEAKLKLDLLPALGKVRIGEIHRSDLRTVLDAIVDRGSPIAANRTLALVRKMFNFAVSRGYLEASPAAALERPSEERARERVLLPREMRSLWAGLAGELVQVRVAIRVLLLTAQRSGEVLALRWSDIEEGVWQLKAEKTKAGRLHRVPLSPAVLAELATIPRQEGSDWVFPSPRREAYHLGTSALSHAAQRLGQRLGFGWRIHDLRRTAASMMAELGVSRFIIGQVLNHADSSVTAIYDRHSYLPEKREALERWAQRLLEIVAAPP
jgi:integrase